MGPGDCKKAKNGKELFFSNRISRAKIEQMSFSGIRFINIKQPVYLY